MATEETVERAVKAEMAATLLETESMVGAEEEVMALLEMVAPII